MAKNVYRFFVPAQAVGANKVFFDLFNGSARPMQLHSVRAVPNLDTAVTGAVAVRLFLTRTSAVGTGGTAATADGTDLTAATITRRNPAAEALPGGISARLAPTGGATAGAVLAEWQTMPEEASTSEAYTARLHDPLQDCPQATVVVPAGTGVRLLQGAVASVGTIGFQLIFEV